MKREIELIIGLIVAGLIVAGGYLLYQKYFPELQEVVPVPLKTCTPRPKCLDEEPRCLMPETEDMCPKTTIDK